MTVAISQILYWALYISKGDCSSPGTNLVTKAEATKYREEDLAYCSHWDELLIKNGLLH